MVSKISKRCHFFDSDGSPVGNGCIKGTANCHYVHPSEPEWLNLPSAPTFYQRKRRTYDKPRSLDRPRHSSRGTPLLNRISHRERSPDDYPYRSRSPIEHSPVSPTTSRSQYVPTFSRAEPEQNEKDTLPDQLRDARPRASSVARIPQSQLNTTTSPMSSSTTMQQPAPLPLLPTPPVLLTLKQPPLRTELSVEEKRKAWAERIQRLSDSFQQRSKLAKIDQEIGLIQRLSLFAPNSLSDSKHGTESKLAALESQRDEARKNYDLILSQVTAIDNWPVLPPAENDDRETLNKMVKYCEDLQHSAEEINHVLSRATLALPSSDMPTGDPSRPLKRRRLEEDGEQGRQESDRISDTHEELRDRALAIQGAISNIQNDQTANRNDLVAECKEYADVKFEEATVEATKSVQVVEEKAKVLESIINSTGDDVSELAGVVGEIILHNNEFKSEIAETNQRIKDTQTRVTQLEERVREITQERSQFAKAIEALKAAHDAHVARPMSPPISPSLPPLDYIVQSVHDPLLEAARSAIKPMLSSMRDNIQGLLQERNAEIYQTLWRRLSLTLKLVDALSARLAPPQPGT